MKDNFLLSILRALDKSELKRLEKFVQSPYHNPQRGVLRLFQFIAPRLADNTPLDEVDLFKAVFPEASQPVPRRLHVYLSLLKNVVEDFFVFEAVQSDPSQYALYCTAAYRKRRLDDFANRALQQAMVKREAQPRRDRAFLEAAYKERVALLYRFGQQERAKSLNLQDLSTAQDLAYIAEKLQNGCMLLSHQTVAHSSYDTGLLEPVLQFLENHPWLDTPAIAVYYHGYFALLDRDGDRHFQALKTILAQQGELFGREELRNIYLMAVNFCIRRQNQSKLPYRRELFDLYQTGLRDGAFFENGQLSRFTYKNMAVTGLLLQEYEWVNHFLETYQPFLPQAHRAASYHFNRALYCYETGDLPAAMSSLLQADSDDALHNLNARVLLAKIYYETAAFNALDSLLDAMAMFIRRNKVPSYHKAFYLNFVRMLRHLLALPPNDKMGRADLCRQIGELKAVAEQVWLLKRAGV